MRSRSNELLPTVAPESLASNKNATKRVRIGSETGNGEDIWNCSHKVKERLEPVW